VDEFVGGAGNDTFVGSIDNDGTTDNSTFTTLDSLDGGDGTDTLKLSVLDDNAAGFPTVDVANVENLNLRAAVAVNEDFSTGVDYHNKRIKESMKLSE
jgi:Ca2+-binding RTX toxin-like protein